MDQNEQNNKTPWWKPGLFIFYKVSLWVAGPLVVALILGKNLDKHFGTHPWIFLGLTAIAFVVSISAIVRIVKKYIESIPKEKGDENK